MLELARTSAVALLIASAVACGGAAEPSASPAKSAAPAVSVAPPKPASATASASAPPSAASAEPPPPAPTWKPREASRAFVAANVQAFSEHDAAKIEALYSPRAVLASPGERGMEESSRGAMKRDLEALFDAFPDAKLATVRLLERGHVAVWEWVLRGTNGGEFMGHPATKKPIGYRGVSVLTFGDDGLVRRETMYFDLATVVGQLGLGQKGYAVRPPEPAPGAPVEVFADGEGTDTIAELTKLYDLSDRHDEDGLKALLSDDAQVVDLTRPSDAKKRDWLGVVRDAKKAFPDEKRDVVACFRFSDEWAACERAWSATWKGPAFGQKATGRATGMHAIDVARMAGGKIVSLTTYGSAVELSPTLGRVESKAKGEVDEVKLEGSAHPAPKKPKK